MKTNLKFTIIVISCFIISCSSESNVTFNDSTIDRTKIRGICNDEQVERLAINDNYSMIVTQCYDQGTLIDIDYEISDRLVNDKVAALDLSEGDNSPIVHVFNEQIDHLNYSGNLYSSFLSNGGDDDDYCECKDVNPGAVDCVLEEYRKIRSCSGNFCSSCSLVMVFFMHSGETQNVSSSVVKLPNNF